MNSSLLYRLGHVSARHPVRALLGCVGVLVVLLGVSMAFGGDTQEDWDVTGVPSQRGVELLREHQPGVGDAFARVVVHSGDGALTEAETAGLRTKLEAMPHVVTVSDARFSDDRDTAVITVGYDVPITHKDLMGNADPLNEAVADARAAGLTVEMNGAVPETAAAPVEGYAEIIGIVLALLIMVLAFGSVVAAGLPIVTAIVGLVATSAGVTLLAAAMKVSPSAPMVASMVGLGVGIDYALLVVNRHVEYLRDGHDVVESAARSVATAGRSAVIAATTVLVSLMGLRLAGLPTYSSFGFATAIAVVAMLAATLVVVPALCALAGARLTPRKERKAAAAPVAAEESFIGRWAAAVGRRPLAAAMLAVIVMLTLAAPAMAMRTWPSDASAQSSELTTRRAYDLLADEFGPGANAEVLIVAESTGPDKADPGAVDLALDRISRQPGVVAVSPLMPSPDKAIGVAHVTVAYGPSDTKTSDVLAAIRDQLPDGTVLTGETAYYNDISDMLAVRLWVVIGFVVAASLVLLTVVFRSVIIPVKAAIMNLLSVAAAYGVITAVFQWGWGSSLLGVDQPVAVSSWVPILIFAILFGLSMDYEVFLLSRIREDWLATGDPRGSVISGLAKTGRVITVAAAVMVAVFLSFSTETDIMLKMAGLGMAVAVFLDATVVRMVLVPATMSLLGRYNWWLPGWLDRILPTIDLEAHEEDAGKAPELLKV